MIETYTILSARPLQRKDFSGSRADLILNVQKGLLPTEYNHMNAVSGIRLIKQAEQ